MPPKIGRPHNDQVSLEECKRQINIAHDMVKSQGATYDLAKAFYLYGVYVIQEYREYKLGVETIRSGYDTIQKAIERGTKGGSWIDLDKYSWKHNRASYKELDLFYEICRYLAFYDFEPFIYYMEKNRSPEKRFYAPRRKTLGKLIKDFEDLARRKIKFLGISLPSRTGKAIAYNTPVLTNHGWKMHGDLTIRDMVIGEDGEWKKILAIHNPCEMEYKVTFSDGEEIICHGNHEWRVCTRGTSNTKTRDLETKYMYENQHCPDGRPRYSIVKRPVVSGSHKDLWVDPYTLGAWLGDGRNSNPDICGAESDYAIIQHILDGGYEIAWDTKHSTTGVRYYGFKGLREQLQHYDMCHSRRYSPKYIPDEYLIADEEQRLELLAGLLDTDGCLTKDEHRYKYTTCEPTLRDSVISLISTFGWRTCVVEREPKLSSSGIQGRKTYWEILFLPTRYIPCQLERKQLHEYSKQRAITIEKIEKISGGIGGNCITVEGGMYCVGKTLKPTHNSTLCIFFLAWLCLVRPNSHSAMGGHSGILAKGFYNELLNLISTNEYTFAELYALHHPNEVCLQNKSAEEFTITLGNPDRFATITCRGIDGTWTGAVDVSWDGILYVDDLVRDREHSLSPQRMENTYQEYLNKMVDRKSGASPELDYWYSIDDVVDFAGACELMVGTLWNVMDPLERMRQMYEDNPLYRFVRIPALDDNDESNFDYEIGGFTTAYYRDMRDKLDDAEWWAKYMQKPYVREGLLMPTDSLRYFNGILPPGDSRVVGVTDVAYGGGDSLSMPIGREYENGDVYIFDWVFNPGAKEITVPIVVGKIIGNEIRATRFEGNQGGDLYCDLIEKELTEQGYKCSCESRKAPNTMAKKEKIVAYSGDVKQKFVFLTPKRPTPEELEKDRELGITRYVRNSDYQKAMDEMCSYVTIGKNEHDDAIDSIVQLDMFVENKGAGANVKPVINPFRSGANY